MNNNKETIYLLKTSPNNESFLLDSCAKSMQGLVEIAENYVCYIFSEEKKDLGYNISNGILTIKAPENEHLFYIVIIDNVLD